VIDSAAAAANRGWFPARQVPLPLARRYRPSQQEGANAEGGERQSGRPL